MRLASAVAGCHPRSRFVDGCTSAVKSDAQTRINAGLGATWDAHRAGKCVAQYRLYAAACTFDDANLTALEAACNNVWIGSVQQGEKCVLSYECAGFAEGTAFCGVYPGAGAGHGSVCSPGSGNPHGAAGDACFWSCGMLDREKTCTGVPGGSNNGGSCWFEDDLFCDPASITCAALAAEGQACGPQLRCAHGAWCNAGTCAAKIAVGGACMTATSDACQDGAWCSNASGNCEAVKADGEACGYFDQCASQRCPNGKCLPRNSIASVT
jgi:hypothetical protein